MHPGGFERQSMKTPLPLAAAALLLLAGCGSLKIQMEYETTPDSTAPARPSGALPTSSRTPTPSASATDTVEPSATETPPAVPAAVSVDAGYDHTCAVTESGKVLCWGINDRGQLGNGTLVNSFVPVEVAGLSGAVAVAVGGNHACALTESGGVKCWGENENGELGNGGTADSARPVDVRGLASGVTAIGAGDDHSCAVTAQGGVRCWGYNAWGQLGDATATSRSVPVGVAGVAGGVSEIAAGWGHTCALMTDGSVECWGSNKYGQLGSGESDEVRFTPMEAAGLVRSAVKLRAAGGQSCAVTIYGGVRCWGGNKYGQLGDGTSQDKRIPAAVAGLTPNPRDVAVGWNHACAVEGDGGLVCWGWNYYGELGDGTKASRTVPAGVYGLAAGVRSVGLGWTHSCAVTETGAVECWGRNEFGQLGDGSNIDSQVPIPAAGLGGRGIPLSDTATRTATPMDPTATKTSAGMVKPTATKTSAGAVTPTVTRTAAAPTPTTSRLPMIFSDVSSGNDFNCALVESTRVFCWGAGESGQLGNGTKSDSPVPAEVEGLGEDPILSLEAGQSHACVITARGLMKCWGANDHGQLGDGTTVDSTVPVTASVIGEDVIAMALGADFTCVRTGKENKAKCWGGNGHGQLGNGKTEDSRTPVEVKGLQADVNFLSAGAFSVCANTFWHEVYCWGENASGQLGDGTDAERHSAVAVKGLGLNFDLMSVGINHVCGLSGTGEVQCWGGNHSGQLGDGTTVNRYTAVYVRKMLRAVVVQSGDAVSCALTDLFEVKCWGSAETRVMGRPDCQDAGPLCREPVTVAPFPGRIIGLSVGNRHACAETETGGFYCWGINTHGQLGDGTKEDSFIPAAVRGFEGAEEPTGLPPKDPVLPTGTPPHQP